MDYNSFSLDEYLRNIKEKYKKRDRIKRFRERKIEGKYQTWLLKENKNILEKTDLIIGSLMIIFTIAPALKMFNGIDVYHNFGILFPTCISLMALFTDIVCLKIPKLSKVEGFLPIVAPYLTYLFRVVYFKTIYSSPYAHGGWIIGMIFLTHGIGFWLLSSLAQAIGLVLMFLGIVLTRETADDIYKMSSFQYILYGILIAIGTMAVGFIQEEKRKDKIKNETKRKEQFFACMSHELRNPLNSLLGGLEIISGAQIGFEEVLNSANLCGEALLNLIGNILDVSKIEAGKMSMAAIPTDLGEKILNVVSMFTPTAQKKGILLKFLRAPWNIPSALLIDPLKINQVLINLLGNSLKFTEIGAIYIKLEWHPFIEDDCSIQDVKAKIDEILSTSAREELFDSDEYSSDNPNSRNVVNKYIGNIDSVTTGSLSTRSHCVHPRSNNWLDYIYLVKIKHQSLAFKDFGYTEQKASHMKKREEKKSQGIVKLEIIDSGIGISENNQQKLFQPFAQAEDSTSLKFGGTGLGLWISQSIINIMGGRIQIESKEGEGSNFQIAFPAIEADERLVIKKPKEDIWLECKKRFLGMTCLYVEDQISNQCLMKEILNHLGFKFTIAKDGLVGYTLFKEKKKNYWDVIITDLRMNVMSGQEMIAKIRKYEGNNKRRKTPIIVTSCENENERYRCVNILGANIFMNKPVKLGEMFFNLSKLLLNTENNKKHAPEERKSEAGQLFQYIKNTIPPKANKYILIVEDDRFLSSILTQFIQTENYQALNIIKENLHRLHLIILDSTLQDNTGPEILEEIIKMKNPLKAAGVILTPPHRRVTTGSLLPKSEIRNIPILSLSGESIKRQKELYQGMKVAMFLQKPVSKQKLLEAIATVLNNQ